MLMDTTMVLEAELHHIRQEMKYLKQLEADAAGRLRDGRGTWSFPIPIHYPDHYANLPR